MSDQILELFKQAFPGDGVTIIKAEFKGVKDGEEKIEPRGNKDCELDGGTEQVSQAVEQ